MWDMLDVHAELPMTLVRSDVVPSPHTTAKVKFLVGPLYVPVQLSVTELGATVGWSTLSVHGAAAAVPIVAKVATSMPAMTKSAFRPRLRLLERAGRMFEEFIFMFHLTFGRRLSAVRGMFTFSHSNEWPVTEGAQKVVRSR